MAMTKNQRTGVVSELQVEQIFSDWGWNHGHDRMDLGYDLFVEPDPSRYKGQRFLVQVKGTSLPGKGAPKAPVSKANLRQYAANRLPVFLIRRSSDGQLHWLHVQLWARQNPKRLRGNGETNLILPKEQNLEDADRFQAYLEKILTPASERAGGVSEVAHERSAFLSSLDERLTIEVSLKNGSEEYELQAKEKPVTFQIEMTLDSEGENLKKIEDAIHYGLPSTVQTESFRTTGSEILSAIGADKFQAGLLTIRPTSSRKVSVSLYPGTRYSPQAADFTFPAILYIGQTGFTFSNSELESLLNFSFRGSHSKNQNNQASVTLGIRMAYLADLPLGEHSHLGQLGEWAYQTLKAKSSLLRLSYKNQHQSIPIPMEATKNFHELLYQFFVLGRLYRIARSLGSDFVLPENYELTKSEIEDIHFLYRILAGERVPCTTNSFSFTTKKRISLDDKANHFCITTEVEFILFNQRFASVPLAFDLIEYQFENSPDASSYRLVEGTKLNAIAFYDEIGPRSPQK